MSRRVSDRVAVFIDGGYLSAILRDYYQLTAINFLTFSEVLCGDCEHFRTYYYTCMPYQSPTPTSSERQRVSKADRFINSIKHLQRFEVRLGKLQKRGGHYEQKGVDVLLSIDLTRLSVSRTIDRAILVSGDSDFVPAVRAAKDNYILITTVYHVNDYSRELFQLSDDRIPIEPELIDKCLLE